MTDYDALWASIDRLMCVRTPKAHCALRGPITAEGLAWLRSTARRGGVGSIHPAILATYRVHDGAKGSRPSLLALLPEVDGAAWALHCEWHSSWLSREQLAFWQDVLGGDDGGGAADGSGWPSRWLPIGRDCAGNAVAIELERGELFAFDHEVGEPAPITTLGALLVNLERDLQSGLVVEDEDGLRRVEAAENERPVRDEHRDAYVFLAFLVERKLALLEPTPSLIAALTPLLQVRGAKRRAKRVRALLYEHGDVADVFAEDDVLDVFIEAFG